jgi:alkanesulfonate monooxygenase SsuD/methylene tetrahydromethanopterin reductase-like flavin-dependent oxidoreductase (luciferase family)
VALPLRFHWHPPENLLEADKLTAVSQHAEECGFESVVVPAALFSEKLLIPFAIVSKATKKIKFLAKCEFGSVPKRDLMQQISKILELAAAQAAIYLPFDRVGKSFCAEGATAEEYYSSIHEFLREYNLLPKPRPEIFVEGASAEAAELAIKFADCLWLLPKRAEQIYSDALPVLHMGKEVGLHASLIARETAEEAHSVAAKLLPDGQTKDRESPESGSCLSVGTPSQYCPDGIAFAGSFKEVAEALMSYKEKGISQFLFSGSPDQPEMAYFARGVLPIVRRLEARAATMGKVAG